MHCGRFDAAGIERIDVQRPQLEVFHASLPQAARRLLIALRHALGANRAVVLVFDLQLVGIQLPVFPVVPDADVLVLGARRGGGFPQAFDVARPTVVVGMNAGAGLLAVLVADAALAQRGRIGAVIGARGEHFEAFMLLEDEGPTDRGRGAEQVRDEPAEPQQVAQGVEIALGDPVRVRLPAEFLPPELLRHRAVEVHARNHLHRAGVPVTEATPVDGLHAARVGLPVVRQRDVRISGDHAGHAPAPQPLGTQMVVDVAVQVGQERIGRLQGVRRRDQLDHHLRVIRRDIGVSQRRSQGFGMRFPAQACLRIHAQGLPLKPDLNVAENLAIG